MADALVWPPKKEDLERLYLVERLSASKIAKVYGLKYKNPKVAESTVLYQLKKNGIVRRDPVEHVRKVTEKAVDEWVLRYSKGESLKRIAGGSVDPVTVWNHLKRRGVALRNKVEAQIEAVTKYERKPFQGDALERAYLMGLRHGDLDVVRHGRAVRVRVSTTHPAMAGLFESVFSSYGHVARYARTAPFTGYEWTLECDLDASFEFLLEKPRNEDLRRLNKQQFSAFLSGFFDAEGAIYLHRKRFGWGYEVTLSNNDAELLNLIASRLSLLGFHPSVRTNDQDPSRLGYHKEGRATRMSIFRQFEVCELLRQLALRHGEKVRKARFVCDRICSNFLHVSKVEVDDWTILIDEIRKSRDKFVAEARAQVLRNHPAKHYDDIS